MGKYRENMGDLRIIFGNYGNWFMFLVVNPAFLKMAIKYECCIYHLIIYIYVENLYFMAYGCAAKTNEQSNESMLNHSAVVASFYLVCIKIDLQCRWKNKPLGYFIIKVLLCLLLLSCCHHVSIQ